MRHPRWSPLTFLLAVFTLLVITSYTSLFWYHKALLNSNQNRYRLQVSDLATRSDRMHRICRELPRSRQLTLPLQGKVFYHSSEYNLSYCRAANVGSTFWAQTFIEASGFKPEVIKNAGIESAFEISRHETHEIMHKYSDLTVDFTDDRLQTATKIVMARNPYSRLLSTYIDQIFLPNKWRQADKMTKQAQHSNCGSNVTFEEFLTAVSNGILSRKETDPHWAPIFSICLPCETNIDILAKHESFTDDAAEILHQVGAKQSVIDQVKQFSSTHNTETRAEHLLHTYFERARKVPKRCISGDQFLRKLWKAFQVKGYLHNEHNFPSDLFKNEKNVESVFLHELKKAIQSRPLTPFERTEQRKSWVFKFWNAVSKETVAMVQNAFYEDFIVFGYDMDVRKV